MKVGDLVRIVSSDSRRILGPVANNDCVGMIVDHHSQYPNGYTPAWVVSFGNDHLRVLREDLLENV